MDSLITTRNWIPPTTQMSREQILSKSLWKGAQPPTALILFPWELCQTSDPKSCKIIHFFKPKKENRNGEWVDGFTLEILNREISDPLVYTGNPFVLRQEVSVFKKCLFIYGCAGSSLLHGILSSCGAQASHCSGFSCCWVWALAHRLSSCGS